MRAVAENRDIVYKDLIFSYRFEGIERGVQDMSNPLPSFQTYPYILEVLEDFIKYCKTVKKFIHEVGHVFNVFDRNRITEGGGEVYNLSACRHHRKRPLPVPTMPRRSDIRPILPSIDSFVLAFYG